MGNFFQDLLQIIMTVVFILQVSAFNAELKYGSAENYDEKEDVRSLKVTSFRKDASELFRDAGTTDDFPEWLANLLANMVQSNNTLARIAVDLANFRGWFGVKK